MPSWPPELASRILDLPLGAGAVAAFDADETLWHTDAGIGFLEWCSRTRVLPGEDGGAGVFEAYRRTREQDEEAGLMACATAFVGLPVARLEELSRGFSREFVEPLVYPAMRELLEWLQGRGVAVYVVTASYRHAALPGAAALGIPPERVVGIRLREVGGVVTGERLGPVTFRGFKASELEAHAGGPPVLAMGNGSNDRELLEAATHMAVAINPSTSARRDGTASLAAAAAGHGWPVLRLADPRSGEPPRLQ